MNKVYYIKGSKENPKGVKLALLEICPNAENINDFVYEIESYYYYVINGIIDYAFDDSHIELLKHIGTELQPKKQEKFVAKTMYQPISECEGITYEGILFDTIEKAMKVDDKVIGYQEVKVMVKE